MDGLKSCDTDHHKTTDFTKSIIPYNFVAASRASENLDQKDFAELLESGTVANYRNLKVGPCSL